LNGLSATPFPCTAFPTLIFSVNIRLFLTHIMNILCDKLKKNWPDCLEGKCYYIAYKLKYLVYSICGIYAYLRNVSFVPVEKFAQFTLHNWRTQCRCVTTHSTVLQDKDNQKQQKIEASTVQSYNFHGPHRAVVSHTVGNELRGWELSLDDHSNTWYDSLPSTQHSPCTVV
jgi:hypothetical protein